METTVIKNFADNAGITCPSRRDAVHRCRQALRSESLIRANEASLRRKSRYKPHLEIMIQFPPKTKPSRLPTILAAATIELCETHYEHQMRHLCVSGAINQIFEQRENVSVRFVFTSRNCLFETDLVSKLAFRMMAVGTESIRRSKKISRKLCMSQIKSPAKGTKT